ncbi:MAG: TonB-dependent receptor [Planctomycetes bacterium]|nr:TonB-dependent receptor [Planctomycetota bacterium]
MRLCNRTLLLIAISCAALAAQDGDEWPGIPADETLVVTATRGEQALLDVPLAVTTVTEAELRRRGDGSIASFFTDIPGVDIVDVAIAGSGRLSIRGEAGSRCLVLIDGEKVVENKSMDGAPLLIDPASISRVEVVKGPNSVLYGSEALGGVVNFITHAQESRQPGFSGSADATYYSASQGFGYSMRLAHVGETWYQTIGGSIANHGDRMAGGDAGRIDDTDYTQWATNASIGRRTADSDISLVADWFEGDFSVADYADDEIVIGLDLPTWSRGKMSLRGRWDDLGPVVSTLRTSAYAQVSEKVFDNNMVIIPMSMNLDIHTENQQPCFGGQIQVDVTPGGSHLLIYGIEARRDLLDATSQRTTTNFFGTITTTTSITAHQDSAAAYAQDEFDLLDDLTITVGARASLVRSGVDSSDDPLVPIADGSDANAVGSLAGVYRLSEYASLRASIAQGYAYPTLDKLYIGTSHGSSSHVYPNPQLKSERSVSMETGLRLDDGQSVLDLTIFHAQASDYISTVPLGSGPDRIYINADSAVTTGVEVSASHTIVKTWTPHLSGTVIRRREEIEGVSSDEVGLPPISGKAGLRWRQDVGAWHLDGDAFLRGAATAVEDTGTERITYEEWLTVNLDLGASWRADGYGWRTSLRLVNITDELYTPATQAVPAAGRSVIFSLGASW